MSLSGNNFFLATTAISDFWITSKNLILLGDWCKTNNTDILDNSNTKYQVMPSPYLHDDATGIASREIREIYECLLPQLANKLNLVHQLQLSERSWRIIVGPWLLFYICSVYDRLNHINQAVELYGDFESITLANSCFITPIDTLDAVSNLKNDFYNLQIFTKILNIKKVNTAKKVHVADKSALRRNSLLSQLISFISINTNKLISKFRRSVYFRYSYFPKQTELNLFIRNFGKVLFSWHHETQLLQVDDLNTQKRNLLSDLHSGNTDFDFCFNQMLPEDLPLCFIENFDRVRSNAGYYYPKKIKKILSANAWYWDESFKYWSALSAQNGALLYGIQHGGVYGSYQYNMSEQHELSFVDKYYSWGWQSSTDKIKPLPATKLTRSIKSKASKSLRKILWVGTYNNRYFLEYSFFPYLSRNYIEDQVAFIRNIRADAINQIVHRPHAEAISLGYLDQLKEASQHLPLELWNVNFKKSLESCSLFVSDHNSTTFLEALSLNIPTILFWNVNSIELKDSAKPYYNALVEQGILFSSGEDAAKAINSILDDIEGWWSATSRQAAVKSFCNEFCNTSEKAMSIWEKEILFGESV